MTLQVPGFSQLVGKTFTGLYHTWTIGSYLENDSGAFVFDVKKENDEEDYFLKLEPHSWGTLFTEFHFLVRSKDNKFLLPLIDFGTRISIDGTAMRAIIIPKKKFCFQARFLIRIEFFKTFDNIKSFYTKIIKSIESINAMGYVNGDIKPKNIVFNEIDDPYIVDFGLVKNFLNSNYVKKKTNQNGTPQYMSLDAHKGIVSQRSDLISFGFVLFEILEKKRLYWEKKTGSDLIYWKELFIKNEDERFYKDPYLIKYFTIVNSRDVNERPLFEELLNIFNS